MCETSDLTTPYTYEEIEEIANFLKTKTNVCPKIGVFCGTGLGNITKLLEKSTVIPYSDIPNFPTSTVQGHNGKLHFGYIHSIPAVCMQGRFHLFEGYPLYKCVLPVRVMKLLGVTTLILSNAAGSLNSSYNIGDVMLLKDHLNFVGFSGHNPLQGPNDERFGKRFVAVNDAYDRQLLKIAKEAMQDLQITGVQEGVYVCLGGPSFETVAELKALKMLGGDAVGMSTVHEVITARHCGIRCLAFSLITNKCPMEYESELRPDHEEILEVGQDKQEDIVKFVGKVFEKLANTEFIK